MISKAFKCFQFISLTVLMIFSSTVHASIELASTDIIGLGFQDLEAIEVTSVSKRENKLSETAAAVYVITSEEIRRSGATSIPGLLRLVPGLEVAHPGSSTWAVSSRGFNSLIANKLLVMIDGRSVYTPLYSGVFWDVQNVLLDNIERIEIIRGPGAAVWGANAVNGVINIIRKTAGKTQGGRISAGGGTEEKSFGNARYGGKFGDNGYYRVASQYFDRDSTEFSNGMSASDNWHMTSGGTRFDLQPTPTDSYI